jgi:alpha-L-rhamnosidase
MGFTFQINNDVKFNHDQRLLNKANDYRPNLHTNTMTESHTAQLVQSESWLGGVGITLNEEPFKQSNPMKRGDSLILDFGDHIVGNFSIHIASVGSPMDAPLTLRLKFAEMPVELSQESSTYDGWLSKSWIQEETIHLDSLPVDLELPRRYSFRYVELKVLDTSPKWQVVFSEARAKTISAVKPMKPVMVSNDPQMQRIYEVGCKTLQDCMQEVFEDGPKRDRRLWLGDLRLQALSDYATFNDTTLIKRCLYLFAGMNAEDGRISANVFVDPDIPDDTFLFDYGLFFISALSDLMAHEKDMDVLDDLYPIAKMQMDIDLDLVNNEGALNLKDTPVFVDWSNDFDKTTATYAILIYTLRQFIGLTELIGGQTEQYNNKLTALVGYSKSHLFDNSRGLFISGPNKEFNVASQVWMVLAQVFDDAGNHALMSTTVRELFPVTGIATPYMYHHIVEALFVSGLRDQAVILMKNYWGKMIDLGADTYWEAFDPNDPNYSPYGSTLINSYCHAWSCTPVYLIKKYLPLGQ